jgi:hypothetical protein
VCINGDFAGINASGLGLTGSVPADVYWEDGSWIKMTTMRLEQNKLQSTLPPGLGELIRLEHFDCSENLLTGELPPLDRLTALTYLSLANNNFLGHLNVSANTKLETLLLSSNTQLHGTLDLTQLTSLTRLRVGGTRFFKVLLSPAATLTECWTRNTCITNCAELPSVCKDNSCTTGPQCSTPQPQAETTPTPPTRPPPPPTTTTTTTTRAPMMTMRTPRATSAMAPGTTMLTTAGTTLDAEATTLSSATTSATSGSASVSESLAILAPTTESDSTLTIAIAVPLAIVGVILIAVVCAVVLKAQRKKAATETTAAAQDDFQSARRDQYGELPQHFAPPQTYISLKSIPSVQSDDYMTIPSSSGSEQGGGGYERVPNQYGDAPHPSQIASPGNQSPMYREAPRMSQVARIEVSDFT